MTKNGGNKKPKSLKAFKVGKVSITPTVAYTKLDDYKSFLKQREIELEKGKLCV